MNSYPPSNRGLRRARGEAVAALTRQVGALAKSSKVFRAELRGRGDDPNPIAAAGIFDFGAGATFAAIRLLVDFRGNGLRVFVVFSEEGVFARLGFGPVRVFGSAFDVSQAVLWVQAQPPSTPGAGLDFRFAEFAVVGSQAAGAPIAGFNADALFDRLNAALPAATNVRL